MINKLRASIPLVNFIAYVEALEKRKERTKILATKEGRKKGRKEERKKRRSQKSQKEPKEKRYKKEKNGCTCIKHGGDD